MREEMNLEKAREIIKAVAEQPRQFLFGLDQVIDDCMIGLFARAPYSAANGREKCYGQGHILLMSVPGTGKTELASALAAAMDAKYQRIQGVPDLLPSAVTGSLVFDQKTREFKMMPGPIFGHVVLIDELNRIIPKTKSAILQPMEERAVTIGEAVYPLMEVAATTERFFWVLATANPIESEGTYPLTEAELDRFFMRIRINYPDRDSEMKISAESLRGKVIKRVANPAMIMEVARFITDYVKKGSLVDKYVVEIFDASRPERSQLKEVLQYIEVGISPRNEFQMKAAAVTRAFLRGGDTVLPDDVKYVARLVLPHKLVLKPQAQAQKITPDEILELILDKTPVP
ncbi:MAG: MoxR family ATPase [bacterium]|nr:MoxR family ATPase [bacterium]